MHELLQLRRVLMTESLADLPMLLGLDTDLVHTLLLQGHFHDPHCGHHCIWFHLDTFGRGPHTLSVEGTLHGWGGGTASCLFLSKWHECYYHAVLLCSSGTLVTGLDLLLVRQLCSDALLLGVPTCVHAVSPVLIQAGSGPHTLSVEGTCPDRLRGCYLWFPVLGELQVR